MAYRLLPILAVLWHLTFSAQAQREYVFNRLSIQDGLLSNNILCVWQDEKGFLWIGTENGLQRHDGYSFRTILQRQVDQILRDGKNNVWIRSGKSVGLFNPSTFAFTEVSVEGDISKFDISTFWLNTDASKNIYLIIRNSDCKYYDSGSHQFTRKANPFTIPDNLRMINVVEDTIKKRYWVHTYEGIGYYDIRSKQYYSTKNNAQHDTLLSNKNLSGLVSHFYIDQSYRFWIQSWVNSDMRFTCFDGKTNTYTHDTAGLSDKNYFDVYAFKQFNDTTFFVYGKNCLRLRDNDRFVNMGGPLYNPYAIRFNTVYQVFEDRERILWFATDNGLYNTTGNINRNLHIILAESKSNASINALYEDENNYLWMGTWGEGVIVADPLKGRVKDGESLLQFPDGFTKLTWTICPFKRSNDIWIGCQEGRLLVYNTVTKKSRYHRPPAFRNSTIRHIVGDNKNRLWIGLHNGDVLICDNPGEPITDKSFRLVKNFTGYITKILFTPDGRISIAANGQGIYIFDAANEKIVETLDKSTISSPIIGNIRDILSVNDSIDLWAGDQLGIYHKKTKQVSLVSQYDNLPIGSLYSLQKDLNNDCWIASSNGIYKYNPVSHNLTRYSQRDGLLTIHNSSYIPETSIRLHNNFLAFAGNQHLVAFNPAQYKSSSVPPNVLISGFQLNNHYLQMDSLMSLKSIRLPYSGHSFSIEFASMSFMQHEKLNYEYMLEGSDEPWTSLKSPLPIKYNLLPHGHYRFLVRARDAEGNYSKETTALPIYIAPPFWKTIWFYILITSLVAGILYYLHRLRLQRLLQVEKVRSRLARDLHDDMGSTLSTINILSNIAILQSPLDEKVSKEYMTTINTSTTQMMESMDDIVWSINPVNDSFTKVLARMKEVAGSNLEANEIEYDFEVAPSVKDLNFSMEVRRDIFLVFKEALNNIIKYSKCTHVKFKLSRSAKDFVLLVEDNGVGFDPELRAQSSRNTRGNGLKNMKKRAESINGQLVVDSAPGKGTRVSFAVPIT